MRSETKEQDLLAHTRQTKKWNRGWQPIVARIPAFAQHEDRGVRELQRGTWAAGPLSAVCPLPSHHLQRDSPQNTLDRCIFGGAILDAAPATSSFHHQQCKRNIALQHLFLPSSISKRALLLAVALGARTFYLLHQCHPPIWLTRKQSPSSIG